MDQSAAAEEEAGVEWEGVTLTCMGSWVLAIIPRGGADMKNNHKQFFYFRDEKGIIPCCENMYHLVPSENPSFREFLYNLQEIWFLKFYEGGSLHFTDRAFPKKICYILDQYNPDVHPSGGMDCLVIDINGISEHLKKRVLAEYLKKYKKTSVDGYEEGSVALRYELLLLTFSQHRSHIIFPLCLLLLSLEDYYMQIELAATRAYSFSIRILDYQWLLEYLIISHKNKYDYCIIYEGVSLSGKAAEEYMLGHILGKIQQFRPDIYNERPPTTELNKIHDFLVLQCHKTSVSSGKMFKRTR